MYTLPAMGDLKTTSLLKPLVTTAIVTTLLVCIIWAWAWHDLRNLNNEIIHSYADRTQSLDNKLRQQANRQQDLFTKLAEAQEARYAAETNLEINRSQLQALQENISTEKDNWQDLYIAEQRKNETLAETSSKFQEEIKQLKQAHKARLDALQHKNNKQIAALRQQISASLKQFPLSDKNQTGTKKASVTDYRFARLKSLADTMKGLPSADRKNILIKVIPTVPQGITGTELIQLTSSMASKDILAVIQSTKQSIQRPIDDKIRAALLNAMEKTDAELTIEILRP